MRLRDLPVVTEIKTLLEREPARALAYQNQIVIDLYRQPGFQLVAAILQTVEKNALDAIRAGATTEKNVERAVGRIAAVEEIRKLFVSLLPAETEVQGLEGEEELELDGIYSSLPSGFDIPPPAGEKAE